MIPKVSTLMVKEKPWCYRSTMEYIGYIWIYIYIYIMISSWYIQGWQSTVHKCIQSLAVFGSHCNWAAVSASVRCFRDQWPDKRTAYSISNPNRNTPLRTIWLYITFQKFLSSCSFIFYRFLLTNPRCQRPATAEGNSFTQVTQQHVVQLSDLRELEFQKLGKKRNQQNSTRLPTFFFWIFNQFLYIPQNSTKQGYKAIWNHMIMKCNHELIVRLNIRRVHTVTR